jgi:hypothetical protein
MVEQRAAMYTVDNMRKCDEVLRGKERDRLEHDHTATPMKGMGD